MKRIYLLAYITILCCLCPLLKAQLGPMPFTPVPPNDPSLVRLLNSDVRCRQWVDSVMQRLTLKERIGQLFIYTIAPQQDKANKELLRKVVEDYKVGGLLFSGGLMQNQVMLTNEAQRMAEVPLMITFDGEWGLAMRLRGTPNFPRNMVLGCIQNDTLIYEYGREVARQCRELGVQVNFAPVADVNINPKNPVINTRSFGESPFNVANKVVAYSKGLEDGGVLSVSKHFPGHGDTDVDSHKALPVLPFTRARLDSIELYPFRKAIRAGLGGLMVGRTPEFLGKKVEAREMKIATIVALLHPLIILGGVALSCFLFAHYPEFVAGEGGWLNNPSFHGLSEQLYEYTSAAANNGSGFEGLGDNTYFWNYTTGWTLILGRFLPIVGQVAIAGLLAGKKYVPESAGTLKTDTVTFGVMTFAVIFIVAALSFFPAHALSTIAEHFSL